MTRTNDGISVDGVVHAMNVIDTIHHEVHEGEFWIAENLQTGKTAFDWLLTVPANKSVHLAWEIIASGAATVTIYRGAAATASANAVLGINSDHSVSESPLLAICHTPTAITTGSDVVGLALLASGNRAGSEERGTIERILKPGSKYLFRFAASPACDVLIRWKWYEESLP